MSYNCLQTYLPVLAWPLVEYFFCEKWWNEDKNSKSVDIKHKCLFINIKYKLLKINKIYKYNWMYKNSFFVFFFFLLKHFKIYQINILHISFIKKTLTVTATKAINGLLQMLLLWENSNILIFKWIGVVN